MRLGMARFLVRMGTRKNLPWSATRRARMDYTDPDRVKHLMAVTERLHKNGAVSDGYRDAVVEVCRLWLASVARERGAK